MLFLHGWMGLRPNQTGVIILVGNTHLHFHTTHWRSLSILISPSFTSGISTCVYHFYSNPCAVLTDVSKKTNMGNYRKSAFPFLILLHVTIVFANKHGYNGYWLDLDMELTLDMLNLRNVISSPSTALLQKQSVSLQCQKRLSAELPIQGR